MRPRSPADVESPSGTDAPSWWADDRLTRVWGLIGDRLERGGLQPEGQVRIEKLSRAERHAVSDLLGRPVTASQVVIGLSDLQRHCGPGRHWSRRPSRSPSAASWTAARSRPSGGPGWTTPPRRSSGGWPSMRAGLAVVAGLARRDAPRRVPLAMRRPRALVLQALTVLFDRREALAADAPGAPVARTELAARTAYDAHALDPDRRLSTAVLRALAARAGLPPPTDAASRRELWEVRVFWWTRCRRRVWSGTSSPTRRLRVRPEAATEGRGTSPGGTCDTVWLPRTGNGCWSARTRACWKRWPSLTQMELAWSAPWGVRTSSRKSAGSGPRRRLCPRPARRLRLAGSRHGERGASPVRRVMF